VIGSALRNWTQGNWVNGTKNPSGAPSLYGANFQTITWAQQNAGYLDAAGNNPNKSLASALHEADARLGAFLNFLKSSGKLDSTLVIIGSKQGQGPINPKTLKVSNPDFMDGTGVPVAFFVGEDGGVVSARLWCRWLSCGWLVWLMPFLQMWLEKSSDAQKAKSNLLANSSLGISYVLAGDEVTAAGYGSPFLDSRVPDLIIGAKVGTLWNDGFEFEDHGGFLPQDLDVPLIAYNPNLKPANITQVVSNRQVASTMLQALGLPLAQLDAYRLGDSPVLPGLFTWAPEASIDGFNYTGLGRTCFPYWYHWFDQMCNIGLKVLKARDIPSNPKITHEYEWMAKAIPIYITHELSLVAIQLRK
jgi:hypothetical protein